MKKFGLFLIAVLSLCFVEDIEAAKKCNTNNNVKTCTEVSGNFYYEDVYTYQDTSLKKYKKIVLMKKSKDKKVTFYNKTSNYTNSGIFANSTYLENNASNNLIKSITTSAHTNGKKATVVQRNYTSNKNTYTLTTKFNANGYQYFYYSINTKANKVTLSKKYTINGKVNSSSEDIYNNKNKLTKNISISYHCNGKKKQIVEKRYSENRVYYTLTKKYSTKGYINYYYLVNTSGSKIITQKKYNSKGKIKTTIVTKHDKKNIVISKATTTHYSNGRKNKVVTNNYTNKKLVNVVTDEHKNNATSNRIANNVLYYNSKVKKYKRITNYYNGSSFKHVGVKDTRYHETSGKITSSNRTQYYHGTTKIYYKATYTYSNGKHIQSATNYYTNTGVKYKYNLKKYNTSAKKTSDLTTHYSNNKAYLKVGYSYQSTTYKYHRTEYKNGVICLNDVTTYKNGTITKTNYLREYYNNKGVLVEKDDVVYSSGNVKTRNNTINSTTTSSKVASVYPVTKGLITSPSWFYPASFGGGWHPGIDVATYSIKTYGYAQPIKVINDATVIKRSNTCASTNSYGCGEGFGNYVVVATQIDGKFYTILYAHQTKLSSSKAKHKEVLDKDKVGYKKNEVIGYVGSSGYSSGYHVHIQVQEHRYAKSIADIQARYKTYNKNTLFNVSYNDLGNNSDIFTINPDVLFNLKYNKSW
ncbi:murein DD-endopeptidase MepM/ murein hydrolase activator NlpD [Bacilli bacterium PM5-3]|nr:murein DD-endopeptidase MepM/ murein hydrolase activator NlpD [Bacilli bacterium PM5-3]